MEGGKVKEADIDRAIKVLRAHNIGFLFPIGGGDSAETALLLNQGADERGYRLRVMHVPKTVDNDLMGTERCPGYISAAAFIINYLLGTYFDAQSNGETIDLNVVMGRNAGWLAASAAYCGKGWHVPLIITPENPVPVEAFIELAARAYKESGGVLQVVVSEGARDDKGEWGKQLAEEMGIEARTDTTGRAVLSDIPLANLLAPKLKKATGARVVADTLGYGQRSFNGAYAKSDGRDAERVGRLAVRRAAAGESGKMINIRAERDPFYTTRYGAVDLSEVAKPGEKMIREVPRYFFDKNGQPNDLFVKELEPLLDDEIPDTEMLDLDTRVKKLEL
jgi:6-phosphofructokinase 1